MRWGRWRIGIILALAVAAGPASAATILYVDDDAAPRGDGLSWPTAFNDLTDALQAVDESVCEIWVAQGTYIPTVEFSNGSPGSVAFWMPNNVSILGGFVGNESDSGDRDPDMNQTILSGELGVPGDPTDNSWHVLQTSSLTDNTAVLDGFVIAHGYAYVSSGQGAGANLDDGDPVLINCWFVDNDSLDDGGAVWSDGSPTFIDCTFTDNHCGTQGSGGAALYCSGSLTITGCTFQDNVSDQFGGALIARNATISDCIFDGNVCIGGGGAMIGNGAFLNVTDCLFSNNSSTFNDGGAIFASADAVTLVNCTFIGNSAFQRGGAIDSTFVDDSTTLVGCSFLGNLAEEGGGVMDWSDVLRVINCSFSGNSAGCDGGAIWANNPLETTIAGCTIVANSAEIDGGGIFSPLGTTTVANTILWLNTDGSGSPDETAQVHSNGTLDINYSLVTGLTGGFGGTGNFDQDPMLLDAIGDDFAPGTADDDLRLIPGSPCIDVGSNSLVPADSLDLDDDLDTTEPIPFDGYGGTRFYDDPATNDGGQGTAPIVDVGAHEFDETTQKKGPDPGEFLGPSGGSWFEPNYWAGGAVPDSGTNVLIKTLVEIDQPGAVANIVLIESGGTLVVGAGTLAASQIVIASGGLLILDHATAQIDVGVVTVQFGGTVLWNAGTVAVEVSWDDPNGIVVGCSGVATLLIGQDATVTSPVVEICAAGTLVGAGTVIAVVSNDGVVVPGGSTGSLTIDGDFTQSVTGTLLLEVGGYLAGMFDQLLVTGTATLDGTIDIAVVGSFVPELAGDHRLIRADELNGVFATENIAVLAGTFLFQLGYDLFDPDGLPRTLQLLTTLTGTGPRIYVNAAAGPGGDGQSWPTATNDVTAALEFAPLFPGTVNEIWVQSGLYKPGRGTDDRSSSFVLVPGVAVYGGFVGDENDLGQRDYTANITSLSGDYAGDDGPGFAGNAENAFHVVASTLDGDRDPLLDGFVITGGNANDGENSDPNRRGGGFRNLATFAVIANCTFSGNAASYGGAVNDGGSDTVFSNCTFTGNEASNGGAINGGSGVRIGCRFDNNEAGQGGAVWGTSSQTVYEDCLFQSNAAFRGGAIYGENNFNVTLLRCDFISNDAQGRGAAIRLDDFGCRLQAIDCDFVVNTAESGGAVSSAADQYSFDGCLFENNLAAAGGAVHARAGVPIGTFTDCTFIDNVAVVTGGALDLNFGTTAVVNCSFRNQRSWGKGGAILYENAVLTLINSEFIGNEAVDRGGAIATRASGAVEAYGTLFQGNSAGAFGGAVAVESGEVSSFTNCLFAGNSALNGGALHSIFSNPELVNCTIVDNTAVAGGGLFSDGTVPSVANCILWGNLPESLIQVEPLPVVTYSDVEGGFVGEGNIDALPGFADPDGPDDDPATVDDNDYRLSAGSPCIDAANNTVVPECGVVDFDGLSRFADDPATADTGLGDPPITDMGAWELGARQSPDDCNGNGIADACDAIFAKEGDCDGNGLPDVCEFIDCNGNEVTDQCDIADGVSRDCNANGIPDECEADCDGNGVPDECEQDCNNNGLPDPCDIDQGLSEDFNDNGTPDECECFDIGGADGVEIFDILIMFANWGPNPGNAADFDNDGIVGILDFLFLLRHWGPCP